MTSAKNKVCAAFELMEKLSIDYYCFHDRDIAPEADNLKQTNERLDEISDLLKELMDRSGKKLLWGTANCFNNPRYIVRLIVFCYYLEFWRIFMIYLDLQGKWDIFLDEHKQQCLPRSFDFEITLPNTTSNAQLGPLNTEKNYGCLTDMYKFEGYAWYRRKIFITPEQSTQNVMLFLERTRKTTVYIDGQKIGSYCSLCTPHRYLLTGISSGEHEFVICVDNTDYPTVGGHLTSKDTQTNWNGITGEIALLFYKSYPEAIRVLPNISDLTVRIDAEIVGESSGTAELRVFDENGEYGACIVEFSDENPLVCMMELDENAPLWSEHSPSLVNLEMKIGADIRTVKFGLRNLTADGLKLKINGEETFLRGKHDGLVFPKTGFAPTDFESWIKVFQTAMQYGINHYRFHTCCPPKAAFEAADYLGIYMQPELPFWGSIPEEPNDEFEFLKQEGFRILREFGYHPSFVMMSMGNELWGSDRQIDNLLCGYKDVDPDKHFTQGSNNFQFVPRILEHDDFFSGVRFSKERLIRGSYASCDMLLDIYRLMNQTVRIIMTAFLNLKKCLKIVAEKY